MRPSIANDITAQTANHNLLIQKRFIFNNDRWRRDHEIFKTSYETIFNWINFRNHSLIEAFILDTELEQ